ncbi:5-enolpyruvylshikimate-3-phosphate synthase [Acetobacter nitrogenifigens DSM 23921 = NBRC 105050]|uniref:3-phosphoshikimate 1-carboxyvinyltransferase n=1 Tax=Acetobacter nitrogenifigens DSM 23921 = NBRC 105050 TaxID=1120919 RepID=A0A511X902_9PROT|nr:3-phosphoshikimate 1-carboxyvinyltransferase [Acetobacter nitrogenifigens]GBQ87182.1 5-enolpyruvylshikimate-3-phosphate synthase [Acetobacter nitrogenifigens DSM 23921 = NBRC 105050]GEN59418.1 3-phosphoshikimate 1-carboxyvinyltransferase [Acetobacter nitrogenifigens DSM 23921 = NBRC 105050]
MVIASAARVTPPNRPLFGHVTPPGSKSITNRALPLAALSEGVSRLTGALKSDDTRYMAAALRQMGVDVQEPDDTTFVVTGTGNLKRPDAPLFLGNAGTAVRFLTGIAPYVPGMVVLDGDAHMHKRPIAPLIAALTALGVDAAAPTGCPPVTVQGFGRLSGGLVTIDAGLSSQYVSAILMAAGKADAPVEIQLQGSGLDARGYVDLTLTAMRAFGGAVEQTGPMSWRVEPARYVACDLVIEPDASAATYLWAAGALTGGVIDVGLAPEAFSQPDARAYEMIRAFPHMPSQIDGSQMQDAIPTLAVMAAFNATPVRFCGIRNLRVKECDRINALSTELNRIRQGLASEEGDDLIVNGDPSLAGTSLPTQIETYADHRIAMAFALAGLMIEGIEILDPSCVGKTYPGFWDALRNLGVDVA